MNIYIIRSIRYIEYIIRRYTHPTSYQGILRVCPNQVRAKGVTAVYIYSEYVRTYTW